MKFTVGDIIRIVDNSTCHGFDVGDECLVVQRQFNHPMSLVRKSNTQIEYWVHEDDAELVTPVIRDKISD